MQVVNEKHHIIVEGQCEWLNQPSPFEDMDDDWIKILVFYLFHVPVDGLSARGKTLAAFRWGEKSKQEDYKELKSRLMKYSECFNAENFICVETYEKLIDALNNLDLFDFPKDKSNARAVFRKTKSGENDSLLAHIRNALAHGRIAQHRIGGEMYIVLEDLERNKAVSARMIIPKKTLLRWISIIQAGPFISNEELSARLNAGQIGMVS